MAAGEELLKDKGKISKEKMLNKVEAEYKKYSEKTLSKVEKDYLKEIKSLEDMAKKGSTKNE